MRMSSRRSAFTALKPNTLPIMDAVRLAIEPGYETFQSNYRHVHREWVAQCCRAGDYGQALAVLARAAQDRPEETALPGARLEVYRLWARNRFEAGRGEEAEAVLTRARRELGDSLLLRENAAGGVSLPLGHL